MSLAENLQPLVPTDIVSGRRPGSTTSLDPDRWKERSADLSRYRRSDGEAVGTTSVTDYEYMEEKFLQGWSVFTLARLRSTHIRTTISRGLSALKHEVKEWEMAKR